MVPKHETKGDYPNWKTNFNSKNSGKRTFSYKTKASNIYPNKKKMFMAPNHERKEDYYVNPCLSQLKNELQF